jgi:hypothetical protein
MEIKPTTSEELSRHSYREIEPGLYHCPGRLVIVQGDDSALLIKTGYQPMVGDLEEAIRAAL